MARKDIGTSWDRETRNNMQDNFIELYDEYVGAGMDAKEALDKVNQMLGTAEDALTVARLSDAKSDDTQRQLDDIIIDSGTSDAEVVQARGGEPLLKDRLNKTDVQLADEANKLNLKGWELNSKARHKKGITVFISDDAKRGDWDILKPIFESEDVPLGIAIIEDKANSGYDPSVFMTDEELLYLQNELGWEMMSHSSTHTNPPIPDMSDEDAEKQFEFSRKRLEERGFNIESFMFPGGRFYARERNLVRKHYRAARTSLRDINYLPIETHELNTHWIGDYYDNYSFEFYKNQINDAARYGALCIISTHGDDVNDSATQQKIRDVIQYAKTKTDVTNLRDALNVLGNVIEIGDYSRSTEEDRKPTSDYYVVGADGATLNSMGVSVLNDRTIGIDTPYEFLPKGITYKEITRAYSQNAPNGEPGVLATYKTGTGNPRFHFQTYYTYDSFNVYRRHINSDGSYRDWEKENLISKPNQNFFNVNTSPKDLPIGITYSKITAANADTTPSGTAGLLVSYNIEIDDVRYNYQEFMMFEGGMSYRRTIKNEDEFNEWYLKDNVIMTSQNTHLFNTPITDFDYGITYSRISGAQAGDSPSNSAGMLITYRTCDTDDRLNYQEFKPLKSSAMYRRHVEESGIFSSWTEL